MRKGRGRLRGNRNFRFCRRHTSCFCHSLGSDSLHAWTSSGCRGRCLEPSEALLAGAGASRHNLEDVEPDGLAERPALADGDLVALLDAEAGGDVGRDVGVPLLVPLELLNVVEVVDTDDQGPVHLEGLHGSGKDAATDGDISGEGALLVDVGALDGGLGGLEAETDSLVEALASLAGGLLGDLLEPLVHAQLLLVRLLVLHFSHGDKRPVAGGSSGRGKGRREGKIGAHVLRGSRERREGPARAPPDPARRRGAATAVTVLASRACPYEVSHFRGEFAVYCSLSRGIPAG